MRCMISDTVISSSPFKSKTVLQGNVKCSIALIMSSGSFARFNNFINDSCGMSQYLSYDQAIL